MDDVNDDNDIASQSAERIEKVVAPTVVHICCYRHGRVLNSD